MKQTILVTGGEGQVGGELRRLLPTLGDVVAPGRQELNLADPDQIIGVMRAVKPSVVINAGAYTAVDRAESEPEMAMATNGRAPGILAEEARKRRIPLIHFSTDYVFDGQATVPYDEADPPGPINVYGRSKLAGEQAVMAVDGDYLILRTSWVYGLRGRNFLLTILRLLREQPALRIVSDQIGAPTWSHDLADAVRRLLTDDEFRDKSGLYHLTAGGQVSWHGVASAIAAQVQKTPRPVIEPIPTAAYPTPATRPAWSVLSNARFRQTFGFGLPEWRDSLNACMALLQTTDDGHG